MMFTVYETFPHYCHITDAIIGTRYRAVATVATRAEARTVATRWAVEVGPHGGDELGLALHDAHGRSVGFEDPTPPAPVVDDDNIPF